MSLLNVFASIYLSKKLINHRKNNNCNQGFTLLELLISGIIVGILSTVAIPAYVATVDKFHYAEAKIQMSCIKRELEGFRMERGYFPDDVNPNIVPVGIECFLRRETNLTPYDSLYDYENWSTNGACVIKITFFGKDKRRNSRVNAISRSLHQQAGFYNDRERDSDSDDLYLSLGLQPSEVCEQ
ncbi:MAG: type IV pilin protein [Crocosphaera sp.]